MFYDNDDEVGFVTQCLRADGRNILQIFQKEDEEAQADFLLAQFKPVGRSVLDVGCGTGALACLMKQRQPELEFTLLNRSTAQLGMCPPDMLRVYADAHCIPFDDEAFDNVMACYVMGHLRKDEALKEFMRVLKPGGVLFIYDLTGGPMPEFEYTPHEYKDARDVSDEVNADRFSALMPEFKEKFPDVKPIVVRIVKNER